MSYNNEQDGDCLSEIIMVTLVGATPLMLPVQLGRVKALHGCFRGYISDVIYLAIRVFVSHKGIYLD